MTLLIRASTVVTMNDRHDIFEDGAIVVDGGTITAVLQKGDPLPDADEIIDARGQLAMPGLVNAHTHGALTLLRGFAHDLPLDSWLKQRIWPAESKLQREDVYWGTMLAVIEMIRSGVTTFADLYYFPDEIARAVRDSGVRARIAGVITGQDVTVLEETRKFCDSVSSEDRITPMLGPHAPYTCDDRLLKAVADLARESGTSIHTHLSETKKEVDECRGRFGVTPIARMDELGFFDGTQVLAAHCVHVSDADVQLMKTKSVAVAHCPSSNLKLASGVAPLNALLTSGLEVGFGTDGAASNVGLDVLQELRIAALLHKGVSGDASSIPAVTSLTMATRMGAHAVGLSDQIGVLEIGKKADIILVDTGGPHFQPRSEPTSSIVYSARASDVRTTIVNGQVLMKDRVLMNVDEAEVAEEANRRATRITEGLN